MGDGEGKVDVEAGLTRIAEDIVDKGVASLSHFWDTNRLFNQFFDGHLARPDTNFNFDGYAVKMIPTRQAVNGNITMFPTFSLGDDGNLMLSITWDNGDGTLEESVVEYINNMTVGGFYKGLADNPTLRNAYQTTGARLNSLINDGGLLSLPMGGKSTGRPSELLPASFQVSYVDEEEPEIWFTGILYSSAFSTFFQQVVYFYSDPPMITLNQSLAESAINSPGEFYQIVQQLQGSLGVIASYEDFFDFFDEHDAQLDPIAADRSFAQDKDLRKTKKTRQESREPIFPPPYVFALGTEDVVIGARRFEKDYAVFKLSSFMTGEEPYILWKQMTMEAKEAGVKKVMIDISGNGGGSIAAGYVLIMSIFPDIDVSWFLESWDVVFNDPMQVFYYQMLPLLFLFIEDSLSMPESDLQATLDDITISEMQRLQVAAEAAFSLCTSVDASDGVFNEKEQCLTLQYLLQSVYAFTSNPGQNELITTIAQATMALLEYNPWYGLGTRKTAPYSGLLIFLIHTLFFVFYRSVVFGLEGTNETIEMMVMLGGAGPRSVFRGGVEKNVT